MRKIFVICFGLYLACGVVFGLVTDQAAYLCPAPKGAHGATYYGAVNGVPDITWQCMSAFGPVDRLRWVAITTPAWLPLVIRNAMR